MKAKKETNKFISVFVNEMYAILLGIGIGNVLFIQQLNLSSIFEIMMGLFIVTVVLIYWWDWTDFIQDNVVSSKFEFVIDFLILINLEVLFLVFNQPTKLAVIFIILAFLDLCWVINYIQYKSDNFIANSKKWILEKLAAIVVVAFVWILITHWLPDVANLVKGIILIVAFVLIRKISFKQVSEAECYELAVADLDDSEAICRINNSYLNPKGKKSFMITSLDAPVMRQKVAEGHEFFVLKTTQSNEIVGFVELSGGVSKEILEQIEWKSDKDRQLIFNGGENVKYIEKVAIDKAHRKKGIGKSIYKNLFGEFPETSFYAFVMIAPFRNEISEAFHKTMDFRMSGVFAKDEFGGFSNYRSILFFRDEEKRLTND